MLDSKIVDGGGTNKSAFVRDHALLTTTLAYPPFGTQLTRPFKQYMTVDGTSSGSNDMGVNGSVTNIDFYVKADIEKDRYITQLNYIIGYGGSAYLYNFVDGGSPLTNGIRIFYTSVTGENDIESAIKKNSGMLRMCVDTFLANDWENRNFEGINDYGYMGTVNLIKMVPPYGIKLDRGSNQKIVVRIRDNLSATVDLLNFYAIGFERFEF